MSNYLQPALDQYDWGQPRWPEIHHEFRDNQHRSHANLLCIRTDIIRQLCLGGELSAVFELSWR